MVVQGTLPEVSALKFQLEASPGAFCTSTESRRSPYENTTRLRRKKLCQASERELTTLRAVSGASGVTLGSHAPSTTGLPAASTAPGKATSPSASGLKGRKTVWCCGSG